MGAKIITLLVTLTILSPALGATRFFPDRSQTPYQRRYPSSRTFLPEITESSITNRNLIETTNYTAPPVTMRLKGNTDLGYYYVTLFFGTPIQKQTLIVDTGSMTTTIPCSECGDNCGSNHFSQFFNHNESSTFKAFDCEESFGNYKCSDCTDQCSFLVAYQEGSSYSGHFNKDFVVFGNEIEDNYFILKYVDSNATTPIPIDLDVDASGNETIAPQLVNNSDAANQNLELRAQQAALEDIIQKRQVFIPFGCTYRETKLFYEQEADGILGLGIFTNNQDSPPNLLDALSLSNDNYTRAFSLCFAQDGGYFSVNGYNHAYHTSETIQYTDYFTEHNQYRIVINKIQVAGQTLDLDTSVLNKGDGAIVDSGTTLTYFPTVTYNAITDSLKSFCSSNSTNCAKGQVASQLCWKYKTDEFSTLEEFLNTFPTLKFYFGENGTAEYEWKPEDYLYEKDTGKYCMGMSKYERETIFGATFMKNHDILFDKDNKRIGMVRANCSAIVDITSPTYNSEHPSASSTVSTPAPESTPESGSGSQSEPETESAQPEKTPASESTPESGSESKSQPETESTQPEKTPASESTPESEEPETKAVDSEKAPIDQTPAEKDPNAMASDFTENQITQVSTNNDNDTDYWKIILLAVAIVGVSALVGTSIFLYVRYRRKSNYNDMSSEVEVPSRRGTSADTSMENHQPTDAQVVPSKIVVSV